jgi:hypothetical protein
MREMRNAYKILDGKPEKKETTRRPKRGVEARMILKRL